MTLYPQIVESIAKVLQRPTSVNDGEGLIYDAYVTDDETIVFCQSDSSDCLYTERDSGWILLMAIHDLEEWFVTTGHGETVVPEDHSEEKARSLLNYFTTQADPQSVMDADDKAEFVDHAMDMILMNMTRHLIG